jgi:hypothetical protein
MGNHQQEAAMGNATSHIINAVNAPNDEPIVVEAEIAQFWAQNRHFYTIRPDGKYVFGSYLRPNVETERRRGLLSKLAEEYRRRMEHREQREAA